MRNSGHGVLAVVAVVLAAETSAAVRYVVPGDTPGATPASPYTSWATAATSVNDIASVMARGDTVILSNGVHVLKAQMSMVVPGVRYAGLTGNPDDVIITGNGTTRCCYIAASNQVIESLTFSNGYVASGSYGAAMMIYGAPNITISNCVIVRNQSATGPGGITAGGGSTNLRLVDCILKENAVLPGCSYATGAGLRCDNGVWAENCQFIGNSNSANTAIGGGVYVYVTTGVFTRCQFVNNYAKGAGASNDGGAGGWNAGPVVLDSCTFTSNWTASSGGAWASSNPNTWITNCVFTGNRTGGGGWGGALYLSSGGTVAGCTFEGNIGGHGGGIGVYGNANRQVLVQDSLFRYNGAGSGAGLCVYPGAAGLYTMVRNCLMVSNLSTTAGASYYGGAIVLRNDNGGSNLVSSSTIAYNSTASKGGGIAFRTATNSNVCLNSIVYYNSATAGSNDIFAAGNKVVSNNCTSLAIPDSGNTSNAPLFVLPQAVGGDYALSKGSPCIDAGVTEDWMGAAADLAGKPRVFGTAVDMGCYEYSRLGAGTVMTVR